MFGMSVKKKTTKQQQPPPKKKTNTKKKPCLAYFPGNHSPPSQFKPVKETDFSSNKNGDFYQ